MLRRIDPIDGLVYILAQLSGGVLGALLTKGLLLDEGRASNYGAAQVSDLLGGAVQGAIVEGIGTFVLVLTVLAVALNPSARKHWAPLAIGAALGFLVMVFGPLTGGSFNPARWFGPALVGNEFADAWVYIVGPIVGGGSRGRGLPVRDRAGERPGAGGGRRGRPARPGSARRRVAAAPPGARRRWRRQAREAPIAPAARPRPRAARRHRRQLEARPQSFRHAPAIRRARLLNSGSDTVAARGRGIGRALVGKASARHREETHMRGAGRTVFAAILLLMVGTLNIIYGIGALDDASFITAGGTRFVLDNLTTLGWVLIILGVIQLTGGFSLMAGNAWADSSESSAAASERSGRSCRSAAQPLVVARRVRALRLRRPRNRRVRRGRAGRGSLSLERAGPRSARARASSSGVSRCAR